jgi:hypothetical protein
MPERLDGAPVDLSAVEATIRAVEEKTSWSFPLPGRTVIYQLFVSLAIDQGGFAIPMTPDTRERALLIAQADLDGFLNHLVSKSAQLGALSGYKGKEIGFPVVVQEIDRFATRIRCECWPR